MEVAASLIQFIISEVAASPLPTKIVVEVEWLRNPIPFISVCLNAGSGRPHCIQKMCWLEAMACPSQFMIVLEVKVVAFFTSILEV